MFVGHSAAAYPMTQYLNGTCQNAELQILLDPVDGTNLINTPQQGFITHPGKLLPYATPVIIIQAELDPIPIAGSSIACAPENISNIRYYNAMSGPKWFVNINGYDHADFSMNNSEQYLKQSARLNYRSLIKDIILNLSTGILEKDESKLKLIEGMQSFIIPTINKNDYMDYNRLSGGFCERKQFMI